jgi:hypothetical protein
MPEGPQRKLTHAALTLLAPGLDFVRSSRDLVTADDTLLSSPTSSALVR